MLTPPRNPYIAGKALGDSRGFFGREDIFRLVETTLSSPDQNSIVLFGQRRIGKTSILLNLRSRLPCPPFVPIYFDLMDRARKSLAEVSYELAATIAQDLNLSQPASSDFNAEGFGFRERFLPTVYKTLGVQKRLVLLMDEFDVMDIGQEERLSVNAAARAFFPYLRQLMANEPRLGFVFVVGRKTEELGIEFKATFKAARYHRVSILEDEAAKALVLQAESEGLLHFASDSVSRILELTARHPYFTQLMCQLIFEKVYREQSHPGKIPIVNGHDVEETVPRAIEAGENVFEWIWDGLPPAERVIFSAIAQGSDEYTVVTQDQVLEILQSQGIRILIRELELAPKTLIEWEMLKTADGGYRFLIELMRRWVSERKPLTKVKDDLDRVVPLADTLYQTANGYFRREMLDNAITQIQSTLTINPNHLKARLLLGEIYRRKGLFDDAVRELEGAYSVDQDATRIALENLLLQRAEQFEKGNQIDDALKDYAHVLAISPNNRHARERHAVVQELQRKRELEKKAASAQVLLHRGKWPEAIAAFERLTELDRDDSRWKEGLASAREEHRIADHYAKGLRAIQMGNWVEAQRAFADITYTRPDYKEAAQNLAKAVLLARGLENRYLEGNAFLQQGKWLAARSPLAAVVYAQSDYKDSATNLAKAILYSEDPQQHYARGLEFYRRGKYPESIQAFAEVLLRNPDDKDALHKLWDARHELEEAERREQLTRIQLLFERLRIPLIIIVVLTFIIVSVLLGQQISAVLSSVTPYLLAMIAIGALAWIFITRVWPQLRAAEADRRAQLAATYTTPRPIMPTPPTTPGGLGRFVATYTLGDDNYDTSFSLETARQEFLGECGMGISETIGEGKPDKVTAFDLWLFDKADVLTMTQVVMSKYAFNDREMRAKLANKGEAILAEKGKTIQLETQSLRVAAQIVELVYANNPNFPPNSHFQKLTLEIVPSLKVSV